MSEASPAGQAPSEPAGTSPKRTSGQQPKRRKTWIKRRAWFLAFVALLVVYLSISGCVERMFFYPSGGSFEPPPGVEDGWFENTAGERLHGGFIPPEGDVPKPWPAVLHVHGNAGNMTHHEPFCSWLTERGYAVMLFDYRSYGKSDGGCSSRKCQVGLLALPYWIML